MVVQIGAGMLGNVAPVPGGIGVQEAGLMAGLTAFGIPPNPALAAVLVFRTITFLLPPVFGFFTLRRFRARESHSDVVEQRPLGTLGPVSVLTLGGGGLGQGWGGPRDEAVATVAAAVESGIDLLDLAPMYGRGESERVVHDAFGGRLPPGVRVSTKVMLGDPVDESPADRIRRSLERSLATLGLDRVDAASCTACSWTTGVCSPSSATSSPSGPRAGRRTRTLAADDGGARRRGGRRRVGHHRHRSTHHHAPGAARRARPAAVQAIADLLDSAAEIRRYDEEPHRRAR